MSIMEKKTSSDEKSISDNRVWLINTGGKLYQLL